MSNLVRSSFQAHPFHLVYPSPWPLYTCISLFSLILSAVLYMNSFSGSLILLYNGLIALIYSMGLWFRDVTKEGMMNPITLQRALFIIAKAYFIFLAIIGGVCYILKFYIDASQKMCAPEPGGRYFQNNVTPQMEGLEELHNNIMFYLAIVLFAVSWVMLSIIINHWKTNHGTLVELIWTITPALIWVLIAFLSSKWYLMMQHYEFVSYEYINAEGIWVESKLDLVLADTDRLYMNNGVTNNNIVNILNPDPAVYIEIPYVDIDFKLQKDHGKLMLIDNLDPTGINLWNHWVAKGTENMPILENWSTGVTRHQGICLNPYGYDTFNMESITHDGRIYSGKTTDRWFRPANYTSGGRPLLYKNNLLLLIWNSRRS